MVIDAKNPIIHSLANIYLSTPKHQFLDTTPCKLTDTNNILCLYNIHNMYIESIQNKNNH